MAIYYMQYPPLPNATTQAFIDESGITTTGNLMSDFHAALVQYCVDAGAIADTAYGEKLSQDDLWNLYIKFVVSGDSNAEEGNPAGAGRGRQGHVGNNPGHYYPEPASNARGRANPNARFPTAAVGFIDPRRFIYRSQKVDAGLSNQLAGSTVSRNGQYLYGHQTTENHYEQWEMTTKWDITTIEDTGITFAEVGSSTTWGMFIFNSGQHLAFTHTTGIFVYELGTPYDVSTASQVSTDTTTSYAICYMSDDGTVMGLNHYLSGPLIYFYTLSTPYDVTSRSAYDGPYTPTNQSGQNPNCVRFDTDGTKMLVCEADEVNYYELGTALTPSTATWKGTFYYDADAGTDSIFISIDEVNGELFGVTTVGRDLHKFRRSTEDGAIDEWSTTEVDSKANFSSSTYSGCWSEDGLYFYYHSGLANAIGRQTASTPFDASSLGAQDHSVAEPASTSTSVGMNIGSHGKLLYIASGSNAIKWATLSTAWNVSTAGAFSSHGVTCAGGFVMAKHLGTYYCSSNGAGSQTITQYDMSTLGDPSTGSSAGTLDISGLSLGAGYPDGLDLSSDGTKLYILGPAGAIHYYIMSTPWDITTATYGGVQTFRALSAPQSFYVDQYNDNDVYCWDGTNNDLYHYTRAGG